jgi:hypothetical protein
LNECGSGSAFLFLLPSSLLPSLHSLSPFLLALHAPLNSLPDLSFLVPFRCIVLQKFRSVLCRFWSDPEFFWLGWIRSRKIVPDSRPDPTFLHKPVPVFFLNTYRYIKWTNFPVRKSNRCLKTHAAYENIKLPISSISSLAWF